MNTNAYRRILLATDGTDPAAAAADVTASMAQATDAEVGVVHVWNPEQHQPHVEGRSAATALVARTVGTLRAHGLKAKGEIVQAEDKPIAAAIAQAARDFEADLVVVGSRGLSDWQSLLAHSVSHQLLTAIDSPVLIVRGPLADAGLEPKRLLLAIAGGDDVDPAVKAAAAAAWAPGSEVLVLHVTQSIVAGEGFGYIEPDQESQATVSRAVKALRESGVTASATITPPGPVVGTIVDAAASWHADIIVIGSSRMGDVGSILFGSVTHGLLRATTRPVLIGGRS
jgi:nucleotide-binding universal stress UspA family protein